MHRLSVAVVFLLSAVSAVAQQNLPASDPLAVSLAQQSVTALTRGATVNDVTLNANVTSIFGSDNESGTATFAAKGIGQSRIDLTLSGGTRTDVRNIVGGFPTGAWNRNGGTSTAYAGHNCWTDAAWFFPVLSSLAQTANPNVIFKYIGQEQHGGVNTQHIRAFRIVQQDTGGVFQRLSTTDFYLDATSNLPLAIAVRAHADKDMNADIPVEVRFASYQAVSGVMVPFHFQQMLNGGVVLDVTVTNAVFNSGLADSLFVLQ